MSASMGSRNVITTCPSCSAAVDEKHRFCPACGTSLDPSDSPTGTAPQRVAAATPTRTRSALSSPRSLSGAPVTGERFAPGTVLVGRYRIVGLLGRGGMGEVYRADDLTLEQAVALKFLPRAIEGDSERLERLYSEVRMARQVSHPAVCRVWDVGEAEGQHFLSMEFVDGENLASLLRRIGRLPGDKALDIARQVAAGLAAAHDQGVLHRDLKPANVMLDGQGKVRLTDFGLAGLADSLAGDVRSGTPSYMSPEQLHGREVTVRSDIYSFGVLLYELFTGRRAFEGRTLADLAHKHRDERPIDPSVIVPDLDPAVERSILACLEKEPRRRPASAGAVLAMLSGQDPLAAAIAAGDTPSPELVAAAGEMQGLRLGPAWACLALVLVAALLVPWFRPGTSLIGRVPVEKSPAVLEDRARELLARLGVTAVPADSETGFRVDDGYFRWTQTRDSAPSRWDSLASGDPPVVQFFYRQSPQPLTARAMFGDVAWREPAIEVSGMAGVRYDLTGRLLAFYSVTPQVEEPAPVTAAPAPDWGLLLAEARLDPARLRRVTPSRTPPFFVDSRAAWEMTWPARADIPIRIEAAGYRGRPVWFEIVSPWTRAERMQPWQPTNGQRLTRAFGSMVLVVLVSTGGVLARRNTRLGRGDRRGAGRLALVVALLTFGAWVLRAHHVGDPSAEFGLVGLATGLAATLAILLWLFYLALEPYVRRLRPWTLVAWTRVLSGGLSDAVVGRDALVGLAWGALVSLLLLVTDFVPVWLGRAAPVPDFGDLTLLLGMRQALRLVLAAPVDATLFALGSLLLFLILRQVTRRDLLAAILIVLMLTAVQVGVISDSPWLSLPIGLLVFGSYVALLLRFGVLAASIGLFTIDLLQQPVHSWAVGSWTASATPVLLLVVVGLALFSFRCALGSRVRLRALTGPDPSSSGAR
jgi:hypothetical protein